MKPEWGTKRLCKKCGAHFYDLGKSGFDCPKCHTSFTAEDFLLKAGKPDRSRKEPKKKEVVEENEIDLLDEDLESLEEADLVEDEGLDDDDVSDVIERENEEEE